MNQSKIVLAGGNGFLGRLLANDLRHRGYEIIVLTRKPGRGTGAKEIEWNGRDPGLWVEAIDGAHAVVNLAGRTVDCRYHAANRRLIKESRVNSTRALGRAIQQCRRPPAVWLNSSTATIYRHSLDRSMEESGEIAATPEVKDGFSIEVAQAWEGALAEAETPGTRKVALRTAMVLGRTGGVFPVLKRLTRLGLGGAMAGGQQFVSWIHETDFCEAVAWLIANHKLSGPVNVCAPNPVTNTEFMREMRAACGKSTGLPATRWMLEAGAWLLRTETELILKSRRVVPGRLLAAGFQFRFEQIHEALTVLAGAETFNQFPPSKRVQPGSA